MGSYNPDLKYRCDIIRGKALKEMDDLLSLYADITHSLAPMEADAFTDQFDEMLARKLKVAKKTISNQRSEMGRLFALYYEQDGIMYESDICKFLIKTGDQPAFFKNLCLNFQFPNGTQKKETVTKRIKDGIRLKPYHFILALLNLANKAGISLEKREIEYYALSSKDVLMGNVAPETVLEYIVGDRSKGIVKELSSTSFSIEPKEDSYIHQHNRELFKYLELANLVYEEGNYLYLNSKEQKIIDVFISEVNNVTELEGLNADGDATEETRNLWAIRYGSLSHGEEILATSADAIIKVETEIPSAEKDNQDGVSNSNQIGMEGEQFVLKKEKERVRAIRPMWENRVKYLGNIKGLGYDIQSVDTNEDCSKAFNRMIEVKSTKRVTLPTFSDDWYETFEITAKEWESAEQFKGHYYIYRVYITPKGFFIYVIDNPFLQYEKGELLVYPIKYQVDITKKNIEQIYNE